MTILQQIANTNFGSSSGLTPKWKSASLKLRNYFKKILKGHATNIKLDRGHFYMSGMFTANSGQIWYISIDDVRFLNTNILIREAKSYTDWTGGSNNYIAIDDNFETNLLQKIK